MNNIDIMEVKNLEQYFLDIDKNTLIDLSDTFNNFLNDSEFIIEFGAGTGEFTKIFANNNRSILSIEIDNSLKIEFEKNIPFQNTVFLNIDIKELDTPEYIETYVIVSAPPYSLLEYINNTFIKKHNLKYILMVGENYLKYFQDYEIIYTLNKNSFTPKSNNKHYIITNIKG